MKPDSDHHHSPPSSHRTFTGMQAALDSGRVYLRHPGGPANLRHFFGWQTDTELCKQQGTISLDCYYESWSSCTLVDALGKELAGMPNPLSKVEAYKPKEKVTPFPHSSFNNKIYPLAHFDI